MMFGYGDIYDVLIIAVLLGVQYYLASQNSIYWGAILPTAFVIWRVYLIFTTDENVLAQVLIILLGVAFLTGQWINGRKSLKKRQKKELLKIKANDLK